MAHQFKVGDRVRLKAEAEHQEYAGKFGYAGEHTIESIDGALVWFDQKNARGVLLHRLEPALIDAAKTYTTRGGRAVRIYATDGFEDWQAVHGAVERDGKWDVEMWFADGRGSESGLDLIEVKPEREGWINIDRYRSGALLPRCEFWKDKEIADRLATPNRIACLRLKFREGEGL